MAHAVYGRNKRSRTGPLVMPLLAFAAAALIAVLYVTYVLWPRWPGGTVEIDAPAIPVLVAGTGFNVEPAAIRQKMQRRPGSHERLDLAYLWPSLTPPDPANKVTQDKPADPNERLFVTIANGELTLPFPERLATIYPRYLETGTSAQPNGLNRRAFRDGTPYQGEDLLTSGDGRFIARCTRTGIGSGSGGSCFYERRLGNADVTLRFPRAWLDDAAATAAKLEALVARLHPAKDAQ